MQLNIHVYKELLQNCAIFQKLHIQEILHLLSAMRMSVAQPSHIVIREGRPNSSLFFIHRGVVRVWKDFEGTRRLLVTLTDNDFFGENSVLDEAHIATATVECVSFVELLTLSHRALDAIVARRRDTAALLRESALLRDRIAASNASGKARRMSYDDSASATEAQRHLSLDQQTSNDSFRPPKRTSFRSSSSGSRRNATVTSHLSLDDPNSTNSFQRPRKRTSFRSSGSRANAGAAVSSF